MQKCWKVTISGAGHLPSVFFPTPGYLDSLSVPSLGNLSIFFQKKVLMPGGWPGGMDTAGIDWRFIAGFDPGAQCIQEWEFQIRCS